MPVRITDKIEFNEYAIEVFTAGKDELHSAISTLKIPQIEATQTVPNGTWVMASKIGDHYEGQVPVWM